ncbi:HoxN/HupN/NixA family nickel/cobalt transporter [Cohnella cellulosilytica]|uniref:Nickel/cobalt efflux system n=1 Tax=Cohnella cellulosilytica TaxID=986710 RepID=A0ABW2FES1_9BACL
MSLLHIFGFAGFFVAAARDPVFWGLGMLAYSFGLRHAFDADHISAIDNTVRKLITSRQNPHGVGLFFSLGHSTVVFLMVLAIGLTANTYIFNNETLREAGSIIGTFVSGFFLIVIGFVNVAMLVRSIREARQARGGSAPDEGGASSAMPVGMLTVMLKPLYRLVRKSWHLYPLGFLFGLGFDTATEIGLLSLSAGAAGQSASLIGILSLPLLFAAGMTLLDTTDGMMMSRAYRLSSATPRRRLIYNLIVTGVSVLSAFFIGFIQMLHLFEKKLPGSWVAWSERLDFVYLGLGLVVFFVATWVSFAMLRKGARSRHAVDGA